ncbi:MAG TPA: gamma-glutamyltransferase [Actinomycetota bacterium]|nr:gamma-glutamyltransferase [Actinomycetota bacterium]
MAKPRLGIAAGNKSGTESAAEVARQGGNAVDACLAAAITGWVAEPFFTSLAGSGFVAVRTPEGKVEIIDGNNAMPTTEPAEPNQGVRRVFLEYSNGMYTGIGGGAVAVPGVLAAVRVAWERHGKIEWPALFQGAIEVAREGLPFPKTSAYYLSVTWNEIWSQFEGSRELFVVDGRPMREGETLCQPDLADALERIAEEGPDVFYCGDVATDIGDAIARDGGFLGVSDLKAYRAEVRSPIGTDAGGWRIESNPPPAVGGAVLIHMLALLGDSALDEPVERARALVEAQRNAIGYRAEKYQDPDLIAAAFDEAVKGFTTRRSSDTTHASSADADGYACSITESNGYGAGLCVDGILLNNTLGEEELNPFGAHGLRPGTRCHSNMTPTIARGGGRTVAIGSPGADRIVTAIAQTLVRLAFDGASLKEAVAGPRIHLDPRPSGELLCFEPGIPGHQVGYNPLPYDDIHMYFGAVQVASVTDDGDVDAAFDPRRSGGAALI